MNKKTQKMILVGGVVATLSFLPSCTLFDSSKTTNVQVSGADNGRPSVPMTGEVLVTMKGRPVITTDTLAMEKEKLFKANPQIKQAIEYNISSGQMDPKDFERNLLDGLIGQKIADEYVETQKINQTAAYKAELQELYESMERMLNAKYFTAIKTVNVSDAEVKAYYDANKDKIQGIMTSLGGVAAAGIEFNDAASARAFATQAKTSPSGFKKAAQDNGWNAKIKDFKLINSQSLGIDETLRNKIVDTKVVPSIELFEAGGKFWVVDLTAKEEPKYLSLEQVKMPLKQQLEQQKRLELYEQEINGLKKQYDVQVNDAYFVSNKNQRPVAQNGGSSQVAEKAEPAEKRLA